MDKYKHYISLALTVVGEISEKHTCIKRDNRGTIPFTFEKNKYRLEISNEDAKLIAYGNMLSDYKLGFCDNDVFLTWLRSILMEISINGLGPVVRRSHRIRGGV